MIFLAADENSMNPVSIECFCITGSGSKEIVAKGFRTENLNVLPKCKGVRFLKKAVFLVNYTFWVLMTFD